MKLKKNKAKGFMLLEALLAVAIFSISVTSIVMVLKTSTRYVATIERQQWISKQFKNILTETLRSRQTKIEFLMGKNLTYEEFGTQAIIEVQESKLESEQGKLLNNLYQVEITLIWYDGEEKMSRTRTTLHHFPLYQY